MSLQDHLARVTPASLAAVARTVAVLNTFQIPHALIGGWAVFAYGSRVPSIDTDILLSKGGAERFCMVIEARGESDQVGPGRHVEILAMDEPNELHGFDWELEEVPSYTPRELLEGRLMDVKVAGSPAKVPPASALAFMKLKAFHDRCFDYRAVTDPVHMARVNPADRPLIARDAPGHFVRKAGKDLFDVAFLCSERASLRDAFEEAPSLQIHMEAALSRVPRPIHDYALGMAADQQRIAEWIAEHAHPAP